MENGETMQQAAARECQEEALATVEVTSLLAVVNVTRANQVHVMFRAKLLEPKFAPGIESLEVRLCTEAEIPWSRAGLSQRGIHTAPVFRGSCGRPRRSSFYRAEKPRLYGCGRIVSS